MKLSSEQKDQILQTLKIFGTLKQTAKIVGVGVEDIKVEMKKHAVFRKRVQESLKEGRENITDEALDKIREYVMNPPAKTDRNQLTAAIALANAYLPGFKGTSKVEGRIEHDIKVITGVPRPNYLTEGKKQTTIEIERSTSHGEGIPQSEKDKLKLLNSGEPINTVDKAVERVIEGEVIDN